MKKELLNEYKNELARLNRVEEIERDIYLKKIADGTLYGPQLGYASLDKSWLKFYKEEYMNLDVEKYNAYDYFLFSTKKFPEAVLLSYYGRDYKRSDIIREVEKYICVFKAKGLKRGDCVSFVMLNTPEAYFMWLALSKMGVISNMIKFDESSERIKLMTEKVHSSYLIVSEVPFILENVLVSLDKDSDLQVITCSLTESLPFGLKARMVYDEIITAHQVKKSLLEKQGADVEALAQTVKEELIKLRDMQYSMKSILSDSRFTKLSKFVKEKAPNSYVDDPGHFDDVSVVVYTGGTTGKPKGVLLTNQNLNVMAHEFRYSELGFEHGKTSMSILPPAIAYYFNAMHGNICLGVHVNIVSNFTPETYPYLLKKYRPNIFMAGPILLENTRKADVLDDPSFIEQAISGGDKLFEEEEQAWNEKYGMVQQGWGMSEGTAASTYSKKIAYKFGSVGIPLIDLSVGVFDYRTDVELPYGEVGELCITGPTLMESYLNDLDATNYVLLKHSDGKIWLHTDDFGLMDNEGHVFHKGRAKRMITRNGGKVWLSDIEDIASTHPFVDKCCAVKLDDSNEREVPVLHIVLTPDAPLKEVVINEIKEMLTSSLNLNYWPKFYIIRKSLPYSEASKKCDWKSLEGEDIFGSDFEVNGEIITKNSPLSRTRN